MGDGARVRAAGRRRLVNALAKLSPLWYSTKPQVVSAASAALTARAYFDVRDLHGHTGSVEVVFRRASNAWRISFLSLL